MGKLCLDLGKLAFGSLFLGSILLGKLTQAVIFVYGLFASVLLFVVGISLTVLSEDPDREV
jgi:hypothetical protein